MSRRLLSVFRLATLAAVAVVLTGCEKDVVFRPEFSINLLQPGPKWPDKKKMTDAQKEILELHGRPEHLRIRWNPTGAIAIRAELQNGPKEMTPKTLPPLTWVYAHKGIEVFFEPDGPQERPVTDEVRLVAQYGDPEDVKRLPGGIVQWTFYGSGRIFKLLQGKIVEERDFQAMGRYLK